MRGNTGKFSVACLSLAASLALIDQAGKFAAREVLAAGPIQLLPGVLELRLKFNSQGAFGLFAQLPQAGRAVILIVLGVLATATLLALSIRWLGLSQRLAVALGLLLGGAISNLADRIASGRVVDFIDLSLGRIDWPTFNVADVGITVGCFWLLAMLLKNGWRKRFSGAPDESGD